MKTLHPMVILVTHLDFILASSEATTLRRQPHTASTHEHKGSNKHLRGPLNKILRGPLLWGPLLWGPSNMLRGIEGSNIEGQQSKWSMGVDYLLVLQLNDILHGTVAVVHIDSPNLRMKANTKNLSTSSSKMIHSDVPSLGTTPPLCRKAWDS